MGFFDKIRDLFTGSRDSVAVEGERVVFRTVQGAQKRVPRALPGPGPQRVDECKRCHGPVQRRVFTTAGPGAQAEVWRAYPVAVDGWHCDACGWALLPRLVSESEMREFIAAGAAHGEAGELDDAEFWFRRAISSWPGYPLGLANLGGVELLRSERSTPSQRGQHRREAIGLFGLAQTDPSPDVRQPWAMIALARAEAVEGDEAAASRRLDGLLARPDVNEEVRADVVKLQAQIRQGCALFTRASELTQGRILVHDAEPAPLDAECRAALTEAARLLELSSQRDDSSFATWWLLGKVHQRLGDAENSLAALSRSLECNPSHADVCREYVMACLETNRVEAALPIAERACQLLPTDAGLTANLALVQLLAGRHDDAARSVDAAQRADPDDAITAQLATVIAAVRRGDRRAPRSLAELEGR